MQFVAEQVEYLLYLVQAHGRFAPLQFTDESQAHSGAFSQFGLGQSSGLAESGDFGW